MENASRQTDEPILLSWEMPVVRRLLYLCSFLGVVLLFYAIHTALLEFVRTPASRLLVGIAIGGLLGIAAALFGVPVLYLARKIICTASTLTIRTVLGFRYSMPWTTVTRVKAGRLGLVALKSECSSAWLFLSVPPDILASLLSLLRETSNARIIGFDSEAG